VNQARQFHEVLNNIEPALTQHVVKINYASPTRNFSMLGQRVRWYMPFVVPPKNSWSAVLQKPSPFS
jgi:hypothetical protein